jgi:NTP pyrophosphatase (non-canonical NTP hydrolase)
MKKQINSQCKSINDDNKKKGFWDHPIEIGTRLMLLVSEAAEALEADRKGKRTDLEGFYKWEKVIGFEEAFIKYIKDTYEDELADIYIRLLDLCGGQDIPLGDYVELKLKYNRTRDHKHGKEY